MDSERWRRVDEIYHAALKREESQRLAFIEEACAGDEALLREVRSLIAYASRAEHFIEKPAPELARQAETVESPLTAGRLLGNRYEVRSLLGRGGVGEVWHAFDLKLRVEVALKTMRSESAGPRVDELLRKEVRSAREVISPNVCRIFDLVEVDGRELVSMEYVDGETLRDRLRSRGSLEPGPATQVALQMLAGLEAIHSAGLIHRDLKPENVMITRSGRVVIMDFGIARPRGEAGMGFSGTPAYMAPEHARGEPVDARADVYAAGLVLAETIAGDGSNAGREVLLERARLQPPDLAESPWKPALRQALAHDPAQRHQSAVALARAIEEAGVPGGRLGTRSPYPGLVSFGEQDAQFFFGREAEVEVVWKKLLRLHLLALVGPSGAGKSSFIAAGLLPALPRGWRGVLCQPGEAPFVALAHALAPAFSGDPAAARELASLEEPDVAVSLAARWRRRHDEVVVVVDQFEELFTQTDPETQSRFAKLIERLALEADVHVLLAVRDDFLFRCHDHTSLAPVFSELTPLGLLRGAALRRALVQPARICGYHLEEALVEEMLADVADERGVLPLVAFAAARLWESRDRERHLLTREAYARIGGVGGALALHAEATLEKIGLGRVAIVRETFRNLTTAGGARVSRDRDELLSVFDNRSEAEEVLAALTDARLLTAFEAPGDTRDEAPPRRRVEVIHESLLSAWPRLVRWQNQEADGEQLREQLRHAAQAWEQRGRPDDLLWTGPSYREFRLWRERYTGSLSSAEEPFASAMIDHAGRRRRRRGTALAAAFAMLSFVTVTLGTLWRQSETARREAVAEARRAEASRLLAIGRLELQRDATVAVAYALKSLELADTPEGRRFSLEALWRGPTRTVVARQGTSRVGFSPDGAWLGRSDNRPDGDAEIWRSDGFGPITLSGEGQSRFAFGPDSRTFITQRTRVLGPTEPASQSPVHVRFLPDPEPIRTLTFEGATRFWLPAATRHLLTLTLRRPAARGAQVLVQSWPLAASAPRRLATLEHLRVIPEAADIDPTGTWYSHAAGRVVEVLPLEQLDQSRSRRVGQMNGSVGAIRFDETGERVAASDRSGEIRIWHLTRAARPSSRTLRAPVVSGALAFSSDGTRLAAASYEGDARIWDLAGPPAADPLVLGGEQLQLNDVEFHPGGDWLVSAGYGTGTAIWPLRRRYPRVLRGHTRTPVCLGFAPDGSWLVSGSSDGTVRLWPLDGDSVEGSRVLFEDKKDVVIDIDVSPDGRRVLASFNSGWVRIIPVGGDAAREVGNFGAQPWPVAFGPRGRLAATAGGLNNPAGAVIRVWDLEAGQSRLLDPGDGKFISQLRFTRDGRLLSGGTGGVRLWTLTDGRPELLSEKGMCGFKLSPEQRHVYITCSAEAQSRGGGGPRRASTVRRELETGNEELLDLDFLPSEITQDWTLDPTGSFMVSGDRDGTVRVRPVTGGPPHLLLGHRSRVWRPAVSPDAHWIASGSDDTTIRLWPTPEGRPFHTLPHLELLRRLRALTNLRVVERAGASKDYSVDIGPFPGWRSVPTW